MMSDLTPEDVREIGRKVAEAWLAQREAVIRFLEGLSQGLADATDNKPEPK